MHDLYLTFIYLGGVASSDKTRPKPRSRISVLKFFKNRGLLQMSHELVPF